MKKILSLIVVIVIIGIMPLIVKNNMDDKISAYKKVLKNQGLDLNIISSDGYINSLRKFTVTIKDSDKLRKGYLELSKQYTDELVTNELFQKLFLGMKFDGKIVNSNLFLNDTEITINLKKLSNDSMKNIDKQLENVLHKDKISVNISLYKSGNIKNIRLKNINEEFEIIDYKMKIVLDNISTSTSDNEFLQMSYISNPGKIEFSLSDENDTLLMSFGMDEIKDKFVFIDKYTLNYKLNIGKTYFNIDKINVKVENISIKNDAKLVNNMQSISVISAVNNIDVNVQNAKIKIKHISYDFSFDNLDKEIISSFESKETYKDEALDKLMKLVNKGFDLKFKVKLEQVDSNPNIVNIKKLIVDNKIKILSNTLNKKNIASNFIHSLDIKTKAIFTKNEEKLIYMFLGQKAASNIMKDAKDADNIIVDITVQNGIIKINGKEFNK